MQQFPEASDEQRNTRMPEKLPGTKEHSNHYHWYSKDFLLAAGKVAHLLAKSCASQQAVFAASKPPLLKIPYWKHQPTNDKKQTYHRKKNKTKTPHWKTSTGHNHRPWTHNLSKITNIFQCLVWETCLLLLVQENFPSPQYSH